MKEPVLYDFRRVQPAREFLTYVQSLTFVDFACRFTGRNKRCVVKIYPKTNFTSEDLNLLNSEYQRIKDN